MRTLIILLKSSNRYLQEPYLPPFKFVKLVIVLVLLFWGRNEHCWKGFFSIKAAICFGIPVLKVFCWPRKRTNKVVKTMYLHIEYHFSHIAQVVVITSFPRQRHLKQTIQIQIHCMCKNSFFSLTRTHLARQNTGKGGKRAYTFKPSTPTSAALFTKCSPMQGTFKGEEEECTGQILGTQMHSSFVVSYSRYCTNAAPWVILVCNIKYFCRSVRLFKLWYVPFLLRFNKFPYEF